MQARSPRLPSDLSGPGGAGPSPDNGVPAPTAKAGSPHLPFLSAPRSSSRDRRQNPARAWRVGAGLPCRIVNWCRLCSTVTSGIPARPRPRTTHSEETALASGIAHDVNQLLALISGYAELARQELDATVVDREHLRAMFEVEVKAAMDAGQSARRLLAFARTQEAHAFERIAVGELLREVADLTLPRWRDVAQAEGRPISLEVDAGDDLYVEGAPAALREALTNLVFNAVDALPNGGSIRLRGHREGEQVVLEVQDTGIGMSPEVQARAFDPFFTTRGERGTGLGLAQVLGIVQSHAGDIRVVSQPAHGTTFELRFPLAKGASEREHEAPKPAPQVQPLSVLAVDDEELLVRLVAISLSSLGHQVSTATSAEEALELLERARYDVVISDLGLGTGMNGWELAGTVRHRWPETRFVLATGSGPSIDVKGLAERGVDAVLTKPYRVQELRQVVSQVSGVRAEHALR